MTDRDWHPFDVERDMEVRRVDDGWEICYTSPPVKTVRLTDAEFEQLREPGPNPQGLD